MSLNLWYGGRLWDPLLAFLKEMAPDILAAQEVYGGIDADLPLQYQTVAQFQAALNYPYAAFAPAYGEVTRYGIIPSGNAVFSRFPIDQERAIFYDVPYAPERDENKERPDFSRTPRNLQHVTIDLGSDAPLLNVFNTQGIWGFDAEDSPRRLRMGERIAEEVHSHKHVILCGDFNVRDGAKTILTAARRLVNVFQGRLSTTFNLRHKSAEFAPGVVDMVFISPDLQVKECLVPEVDVSDHLPLFCRLQV